MKQIGTGIVILFVLISLGIVGLGYLQQNQPEPQATPLELTLTVNPMAQDWMVDAVALFNTSEARFVDDVVITIALNPTPIEDITVWSGDTWNNQNRPDLWLASTAFSIEHANAFNMTFNSVNTPLAQTPLVWVTSADVADAITQDGMLLLDWDAVQQAANAGTWANFGATNLQGNVNMAFSLPDSTIEGLMVLYSASAYYSRNLDFSNLLSPSSDFKTWFAPIVDSVPNFYTIGADVATFMVSRGASVNIGIMPEVKLLNQIDAFTRNRTIRVSYPEYPVVFDFSLAIAIDQNLSFDDNNTRQQAIQAFVDWLLAPEQQSQLPRYGLRPIATSPTPNDELFRKGTDVGVQYDPIISPYLTGEESAYSRNLMSWFTQERTR